MAILGQAFLAFVATAGFAVLFNVPRRALAACSLIGVAGFLARDAALRLGMSPIGATFIGAVTVGLLGELCAVAFHMPSTVFTVTGFIPLLPGVAATRAMVALLSGDYTVSAPHALEAILKAGAIAAGIGGLGAAARAIRLKRKTND